MRCAAAAAAAASAPAEVVCFESRKGSTEVTKKVWEYIKKHKLQDAVQKRVIVADAKLKEVFNKAQVSMFEMAGLIGKHLK